MVDRRRSAPAVSAIIVVRNGEIYLREAIESILAQTYHDWELLVVDDGSTDGTRAIVENYITKSPGRVALYLHADGKGHGISASRNLALAQARGTYVAFLDADDVWEERKLAEQVAIMDGDRELGMVYGRTLIWHSWQAHNKIEDFFYPLGVAPDRRHDPPALFNLLMENKAQTPTTAMR